MVKINKIYTKTGDQGETGLVGGARVSKDDLRVETYGEVDELNSYLGLCRTLATSKKVTPLDTILSRIQNDLFDIGSLLATPSGESWQGMPNIELPRIGELERYIDQLIDGLPELRSFVLPGGTELNSYLHIARSVCRRAERRIITLSKREPVSSNIIIYLNRLSDLLFAMARFESKQSNTPEYLWVLGGKIS